MDALQHYRWPGNVRELRNVMERAALLATGGVVSARDLPIHPAAPASTNGANGSNGSNGTHGANGDHEPVSLAALERQHIERVLARSNWHQGRAASLLGISSKTLYRKIREYGFQRPRGGLAGHESSGDRGRSDGR
jgi:DNA-binding NtrC family response regulator